MKTNTDKKIITAEHVAMAVALLLAVSAVGMLIVAIWAEDWRWFATALVIVFVDIAVVFLSTEEFG